MRKLISTLLVITIISVLGVGTCFAASVPDSIDVKMTVAATGIDVTVSESINMTAAANSNDLTITDLTVQNNSAVGQIELTTLKCSAEAGWTLVADDTDFVNMAKDAQKFSFVADTDKDFAAASENTCTFTGKTAAPNETITVEFTGKTGIATVAVTDAVVAKVVPTIVQL